MTWDARRRLELAAVFLLASLPAGAPRLCAQPAFVATPLTEMGQAQTYLGFSGGLYANGANTPPSAHAAAGLARALSIQPLDTAGNPSSSGKVALVSVGMSNTTQEFCAAGGRTPCSEWTFVGQALADWDVNHTTLALVNGARGGQDAQTWDSPTDPNWDQVRDVDLAEQGLTEAQVQAIWLKEANIMPSSSLPAADADAYVLETFLGNIIRAARTRYPNLKFVFLSSRTYGGYATTNLNPEPYAYESGFAVKWIVQAQIDQMANGGVVVDPRAGDLNYDAGAPWIGWGPYLWADGTTWRGMDGLVWEQIDTQSNDGTHPSQSGETKVGGMLVRFFKNDPRTRPWFLALGDVRVAPTSGAAEGAAVTVTGIGFDPGATLTVGGYPALDVTVGPEEITATTPSLSEGLKNVVVHNPNGATGPAAPLFVPDFTDVPQGHIFHDFVEALLRAEVTAGCGGGGGGLYCVDFPTTRAEMAVFLLRARFGPYHRAPLATGAVFADVQPGDFASDYIEELWALGVTGGCGNGNYCPDEPVTRAQMAVFLLKTKYGAGFQPSACAGVFADVPCPATPEFLFSDWIERLFAEQVTGGCATGPLRYCPDAANLRGEMAVFLSKTFGLQ